jgi:hypothetical protein
MSQRADTSVSGFRRSSTANKRKRASAPVCDPAQWAEGNDVQFNNNCYSYACDIKAGYAQPGLASGRAYQRLTCAEVARAAMADGLVKSPCTTCSHDCHKVALTIAPGLSFHWYRKDKDNTWSHKPGDGQPTRLDYSGSIIYDPSVADRGPFTLFCGCYYVCKAGIRIK